MSGILASPQSSVGLKVMLSAHELLRNDKISYSKLAQI